MTRRVVCVPCARFWRGLAGKYPGERVTLVEGTLVRQCLCDEIEEIWEGMDDE